MVDLVNFTLKCQFIRVKIHRVEEFGARKPKRKSKKCTHCNNCMAIKKVVVATIIKCDKFDMENGDTSNVSETYVCVSVSAKCES